MLIKKTKIAANDIISIKLVNNDELIGKFVEQDDTTITIAKPLILSVYVNDHTGQSGITMSPYYMLGIDQDSTLSFSKSHCLTIQLSSEQAKNGYITNTTGLEVPAKNSSVSKLIV